jgi:hypothetical protein
VGEAAAVDAGAVVAGGAAVTPAVQAATDKTAQPARASAAKRYLFIDFPRLAWSERCGVSPRVPS